MYSRRIRYMISRAEKFYASKGPDAMPYFERAKQVFDAAVAGNIITEHRLHKELNPIRRLWRYVRGTRIGMENMIIADLVLYAHVASAEHLPEAVRKRVGYEYDNLAELKILDSEPEMSNALNRRYAAVLNNGFTESAYVNNGQYVSPSLAALVRAAYISTYGKTTSLVFKPVDGIRPIPTIGSQEWIEMQRVIADKFYIYTTVLEMGGFHAAVNAIKDWAVSIKYRRTLAELRRAMALRYDRVARSKHLLVESVNELLRAPSYIKIDVIIREGKSEGSAVFKIVDRAAAAQQYANGEPLNASKAPRVMLPDEEAYKDVDRVLNTKIPDLVACKVIFDSNGFSPDSVESRDIAISIYKRYVELILETLNKNANINPQTVEIVYLTGNKKEVIMSCDNPSVTITIKDYYTTPKPHNHYRSIHVNVKFQDTSLLERYVHFEVIIRDERTDEICDHGEAAHYEYKLAREGVKNTAVIASMAGFHGFVRTLGTTEQPHFNGTTVSNRVQNYGLWPLIQTVVNYLRNFTKKR